MDLVSHAVQGAHGLQLHLLEWSRQGPAWPRATARWRSTRGVTATRITTPSTLPPRRHRARWARQETERLWRYLAAIPCPTLVVRGEKSVILSAETSARMVGEVLPDGREVVIPGAGHAVMLDAPAAFRAMLGTFLES